MGSTGCLANLLTNQASIGFNFFLCFSIVYYVIFRLKAVPALLRVTKPANRKHFHLPVSWSWSWRSSQLSPHLRTKEKAGVSANQLSSTFLLFFFSEEKGNLHRFSLSFKVSLKCKSGILTDFFVSYWPERTYFGILISFIHERSPDDLCRTLMGITSLLDILHF